MVQNSGGMFVFDGYYKAISSICRDTDKWRMFKAIYEYETEGKLPEGKLKNLGIFLVIKAMIDGKNEKAEVKKSIKKLKEQQCEKENQKTNIEHIKAVDEVCKKVGGGDAKSDVKKIVPLYNENKNKNENENKNENINSSSSNMRIKTEFLEEEEKKSPTLLEVAEFVNLCKLDVSPEAFYNFYSAKAWVIDDRKIDDWRACALAWDRREKINKYKNYTIFKNKDENLDFLFDDLDNIDL